MLKGIDPLLTPELLAHLCAMGHNEWAAIVDANFTAQWLAQGRPLVRLPGHSLARVTQAVLSVLPLANDLPFVAGYMQHSQLPLGQRTPAQQQFVAALQAVEPVEHQQIEAIERFAFYERIKHTSLIIQTGEGTPFGNGLVCKGLIVETV